ncbi:MAG: ATP-binding cassette domain-containing protein [Calditrichaeota bacterium]|nr:MAG: ATP-binding cassette domain-containing protein [Calditrichota bacterium]
MHIKVEKVRKSFLGRLVVEDISFEARAGYVLGILGIDGSGKTTILRMLVNIIAPDAGKITFDDKPFTSRVQNAIGYLSENRGMYQQCSLQDALVYFGRLKNLSHKKAAVEAVRLLDRFGLIDQMDTPVHQLPEEIQQQAQIMACIIHNPDVLVLDEPFLGFTPTNQSIIRKMIARFQEDGKTIIVGTRHMNEAEALCDDLVFLHQGRMILQGSTKRIRERFHQNIIVVEAKDNLQPLKDLPGVNRCIMENQMARLYINEKTPSRKIIDLIVKTVNISRIEVGRPGLEDIYLEMIQNGQRGD